MEKKYSFLSLVVFLRAKVVRCSGVIRAHFSSETLKVLSGFSLAALEKETACSDVELDFVT